MREHHGRTNTREYRAWTDMKTRCNNPRATRYADYGGRGIKVCDRWSASFTAFLEDMGPCPEGLTLDRWPDTNGHYEPGNCRWATRQQQANNKRSNVLVDVGGVTKTLCEWCRERGANYAVVFSRHQQGIQGEDLFKTTVQVIQHNGTTDTISGWARRIGVKPSTLSMRINRYNWPLSKALSGEHFAHS